MEGGGEPNFLFGSKDTGDHPCPIDKPPIPARLSVHSPMHASLSPMLCPAGPWLFDSFRIYAG